MLIHFYRYPDNCPPTEENYPRLRLGFGSRLGLVLGLAGGGNQTTEPEENSPWLGLGFGLGLVLGLGAIFLGANCPRTTFIAFRTVYSKDEKLSIFLGS